jgi:DNA-binding PadR family transcriptional regulator
MSKFYSLGEFEIVVMATILHVGEQAYGTLIKEEIAERGGRQVSVGALYATLSRLEAKELLTSFEGEPTKERGGRAKRYFRVTESGHEALNKSIVMLQSFITDLPKFDHER